MPIQKYGKYKKNEADILLFDPILIPCSIAQSSIVKSAVAEFHLRTLFLHNRSENLALTPRNLSTFFVNFMIPVFIPGNRVHCSWPVRTLREGVESLREPGGRAGHHLRVHGLHGREQLRRHDQCTGQNGGGLPVHMSHSRLRRQVEVAYTYAIQDILYACSSWSIEIDL